MERVIKIFPTHKILAESLALDLINMIKENKDSNLPFTIALSGGDTPGPLFSVLGDQHRDAVSWNNVHFFWVDERCVPPDNQESNFGMTQKVFLSKIKIPKDNIHRIRGEDNPDKEAERYSEEMKHFTPNRNGFHFLTLYFSDLVRMGIQRLFFRVMKSFSSQTASVLRTSSGNRKHSFNSYREGDQ